MKDKNGRGLRNSRMRDQEIEDLMLATDCTIIRGALQAEGKVGSSGKELLSVASGKGNRRMRRQLFTCAFSVQNHAG